MTETLEGVYAKSAQAAYITQEIGDDAFGFTIVASSPNNLSGYQGFAAFNDETGELVISHTGTQWWQPADLFADFLLLAGLPPVTQMADAAKLMDDAAVTVSERGDAVTQVTHVGHSLGGAIGEWFTLIASSHRAIVINSPGVFGIIGDLLGVEAPLRNVTYINAEYPGISTLINKLGVRISDVIQIVEGALGHGIDEAVNPGSSISATVKFAAEFPDLMASVQHELNTDGGGHTVDYLRAVLSGDPQAIARAAMELSGGRLNLPDDSYVVDPRDVGNYPDLILRAAAGITTISEDDDDNDDEQSARELIEQIKDAGLSAAAPSTPRELPMPTKIDAAGRAANDPKNVGPRPILLDLDGNGIRIAEIGRSTMFVDAGGDGLKHRTAWAGAGDGVLFYDPRRRRELRVWMKRAA